MRNFCALVITAVTAVGCARGHSGDRLQIAAAASLTSAFEEIGRSFTAETGTEIAFVFKSSGKLAKQIIEGAPFDVYAAASMSFVDTVIAEGGATAETRTAFAIGRLVAWTPDAGTAPGIADLVDSRFRRIAIANPEHAPYGRAAKQALRSAEVWDKVEGRIVYGNNVAAAMQYADTGNADIALIALPQAIARGGSRTLIPESAHGRLEQGAVVTRSSRHPAKARAFIAYLRSPGARQILARYGLLQPGDG